jgi:hypothetical protein
MYWDFFSQILDARNPLLFRSPDLEKYVKEVSALKANLILLNKVFIILLLIFIRIVATVCYLDLLYCSPLFVLLPQSIIWIYANPDQCFFLIADPDPAIFLGVNRDLNLRFYNSKRYSASASSPTCILNPSPMESLRSSEKSLSVLLI